MQGEVSGDMKIECNESSDYCASVVQRFYRGYRTRRLLADSAVVVEELWWQAINYARLNHSTISFFNFSKPETIASRWIRIGLNASKVGKGLSKDAKGQKLAFQHWIEAIDPRHRYGHSLHLYYEEWCKAEADQPFFYWLDVGDGKEVDLLECPRSKLRQQCIKYFGPQEREHYEYVVAEGKIVQKHTGKFLDSNNGLPEAKWIFVMSTSKRLYAGEKKKGVFHHSTFLAGGATLAAGRLVVVNGILKDQYMQQIQFCLVSLDHIPGGLKSISAYSGHYRPTDERLVSFLSFLKDNGVNLDEIEIHKSNEDYNHDNHIKPPYENGNAAVVLEDSNSSLPDILNTEDTIRVHKKAEISQTEARNCCRKSLFGGLQSPKAKVAKTAILQRINSKKAAKSYQLGHQLSFKWTTGAGPRIGCIADYPAELRLQALEITSL